jgi:hypothetical protein
LKTSFDYWKEVINGDAFNIFVSGMESAFEGLAIVIETFIDGVKKLVDWLIEAYDYVMKIINGIREANSLTMEAPMAARGENYGMSISEVMEGEADSDTIKKFREGMAKELDKMDDLLKDPKDLVINFMGYGSTMKPLSEKADEMEARISKFENTIDGYNPLLKLDATDIAGQIQEVEGIIAQMIVNMRQMKRQFGMEWSGAIYWNMKEQAQQWKAVLEELYREAGRGPLENERRTGGGVGTGGGVERSGFGKSGSGGSGMNPSVPGSGGPTMGGDVNYVIEVKPTFFTGDQASAERAAEHLVHAIHRQTQRYYPTLIPGAVG